MDEHWLLRLIDRLRPPYGWMPFLLLAGAIACVGLSVMDAAWVDGDIFLPPLMALGFLAAVFAAGRKVKPVAAWAFLALAGLLLSFVLLAELWPPAAVWRSGGTAPADFWRAQVALFIDRAAGWYVAVRGGGRSTETIVFALGLAVAGWFVAALVGWSAYGARKPFTGLSLAGLALAANTFYGQAAPHWAVFFFGLAITGGTYLSHLYREQEWEQRGVDYPDEVRTDIILYSAGISLGLMSLAMAIPAINLRAIAEAFQRQESIAAAEQLAERAFAGVAQPRADEGTTGGGGLPRSFLIGGGPELFETVAMTATWRSESPVDLSAYHWRSTSFDIYTGRGWQRSPERETNLNAGATIPYPDQPTGATPVSVTQEIDWIYDRRATRYALGRPIRFSHAIVSNWRGLDEFVGARGRNNAPHLYTVETLITPATPDGLRAARPEDIPPQVRARYTALPENLPDRVVALARDITTAPPGSPPLSSYDQARAIETFLHQYPYTLDLPPPPQDVDIVDYFLFDLQTGFCDYYASAMVVLARAVGLPARLGVGFIQQPADSRGVQTIYQADAHSWAEVYFAGYGWVEFEPTAAFAAPDSPAAQPDQSTTPPTYTPGGSGATALPMPPRDPQRETPWLLWLGLLAAAIVAARLWGRGLAKRFAGRKATLDDIQLAYAHLQDGATALGDTPDPARTPAEFAADLLNLPALASPDGTLLHPEIERLAELFAARQYGRLAGDAPSREARRTWESVRRPLRRIAWRRRLRRID